MYSNNILYFQESTEILNACTKKPGNLLKTPRWINSKKILDDFDLRYHHHHDVVPSARISLTPRYRPLLPVGLQVYILYRHRAVVCRSWRGVLLCLSMWGGPQEYVTYEFTSTSPAVSHMSGSNSDNFRDGVVGGCTTAFCWVLQDLFNICLQHSCVVAVKLFLYAFSSRPCSASIQRHLHDYCFKKKAFYFISQVWFPYDLYSLDSCLRFS